MNTRAALFEGVLDDAAVFPPGNLSLPEAVTAHMSDKDAVYASLVGPLVLATKDLPLLRGDTQGLAPGAIRLSAITPLAEISDAVILAGQNPSLSLVAIEVAAPHDLSVPDIMGHLQSHAPKDVTLYVEVPRDARRDEFIEALRGTGFSAKLRTGGIRADMYPDEAELADAIVRLVRAGISFKATAGLHHAVRNTDPVTKFEQHGFLNILVATSRARSGGDLDEIRGALSIRNPYTLAAEVSTVPVDVRALFTSFGTCSIAEPVAELSDLGLLPEYIAGEAHS